MKLIKHVTYNAIQEKLDNSRLIFHYCSVIESLNCCWLGHHLFKENFKQWEVKNAPIQSCKVVKIICYQVHYNISAFNTTFTQMVKSSIRQIYINYKIYLYNILWNFKSVHTMATKHDFKLLDIFLLNVFNSKTIVTRKICRFLPSDFLM